MMTLYSKQYAKNDRFRILSGWVFFVLVTKKGAEQLKFIQYPSPAIPLNFILVDTMSEASQEQPLQLCGICRNFMNMSAERVPMWLGIFVYVVVCVNYSFMQYSCLCPQPEA